MRSAPAPKNRTIYLGQSVKLDQDYSYDISIAGTGVTISTSTWTADTDEVTLSGAATSGDTTSVQCLGANEGVTPVQNKVTLSNGNILMRYYSIKVKDPMNTSATDYP